MNTVSGFLWVAVGGALGASMRYSITLLLLGSGSRFPLATLAANLSGAFIAGIIVTWLAARGAVGSPVHLFFVVGFLGSFTTLSAFSVETLRLLQVGDWSHAMLNITLTFVGCLIAAGLGSALFRSLI